MGSELPAGINCVVGIGVYTGYNQEDSLIMNQSAIDRGLFRSLFYRTYTEAEKGNSLQAHGHEVFEKPNRANCVGMKPRDYNKLDEDGLVAPGVCSFACVLCSVAVRCDVAAVMVSRAVLTSALCIVWTGCAVTGADILIGKTATLPELITPGVEQRKKKRDTSVSMRPQEKGIVDKVLLSMDKDGQKFVKVCGPVWCMCG